MTGLGERRDVPIPARDIRVARLEDAEPVAAILVDAFTSLYRGTFGGMPLPRLASVIASLYRHGSLAIDAVRVLETGGRIVGVAIIHEGASIGRGTHSDLWRGLRAVLGPLAAIRAHAGAVGTNMYLNRRIPTAPDLLYIEALAVAPDCRRRGVGTALLRHVQEWAVKTGRQRLALHVLEQNEGARRLYARLGFQPWIGPPQHLGPHYGALLLERRLHVHGARG